MLMSVAGQGLTLLGKAHQNKLLGRCLPQTQNHYGVAELPQKSEWLAELQQLLFNPSPSAPDSSQISNPHNELADCVSLLQCCQDASTLLEAQIAHHLVLRNGFEQNRPLDSLLIRNYNRFGAVKDSLSLFSTVREREIVLWNSFLITYACRAMHAEVLQMFAQMQQEGIVANRDTFMQIVSTCAKHADLAEGTRVHARICFTICDIDIFLGTSIISMYDKCGTVKYAYRKWHEMPIQNEVSWTAIIACHVHQGQHKEAFHLFHEMLKEGGKPNKVTFVCILDVFATPPALTGGQLTHHCIVENGFESEMKLGVPLISMYTDCDSAEDAQFVFENMTARNLMAWNAMISTCRKDLDCEKALEFFNQLQNEGFLADQATFVCILGAHASPEAISEGKRMHVRVVEGGFESDTKVGTALINMYGNCGVTGAIDHVFAKLQKRDVVLWTSMIAIYSQHEQTQKAIESFYQMRQDGVEPSKVTFVCILDAYSNSMELVEGKHMHTFIVEEGYEANAIIGNALLTMYGRFGYLHDARSIFDKMLECTIVSWTAMIAIYAHHGQFYDSLELFNQMHLNKIRPNLVTFVGILDACALEGAIAAGRLVHMCAVDYGFESEDSLSSALACMYSKLGSSEDSEVMVNCMAEDSEFLWNVKIALHAQQGLYEHSIELFGQTERRGFKPSVVTYVCVLDACASCAILEDGELIHFSAIGSGCDADTNVATALLNMYGRCGNLEAAWRTFDRMADKNVIAWSAIIALYGQHGRGQDALLFFEQMHCSGILPNQVTLSSVLDACNHSGLIFEAWGCFMSIVQNHAPLLAVDHYVSVVDLLGRTGCLDDSNFLLSHMPLEPTTLLLTVMLGACRYHADVDRAKHVAKFVLELDPDNSAAYVLLSNIYASSVHRNDGKKSPSADFLEEDVLRFGFQDVCV